MTRARASMFSALAGGLVVAVVMAVLPAVAAEGEPLVLGEKNLSATVTRLNTRGGLRIDNFKTGNPALILNVADPAGAPFQVNATGLVDNLNADTVDGQDADAFALDGHEHSGVYAEDAHDHGWADIVSGIPAGLADGDDDTLAGLSCDPGQVIKWNPGGTAWECADDTDTDTDTTLTDGEVFTAVTDQDGTGSGLDADLLDGQHASVFLPKSGGTVSFLTVIGEFAVGTDNKVDDLNADLLDGLTSDDFADAGHEHGIGDLTDVGVETQAVGEILHWMGSEWINATLAEAGIAATGHTHGWADIVSGIPAGLADGDDDALGGLDCDPGQVTKRNGTDDGWVCGDDIDTDTTLTEGGVLTAVQNQDGPGSGIDADLLDGQQASAFSLDGHDHAVGGLSDVTLTAIGVGELLRWTGSGWVNATLAEAGIAATGHTHGWADIVSGIPAGLADGDDDALGALDCDPGQVAKRNSADTAWECGDDIGGTNADTLDGLDSTDFLGVNAQASDSAALGGAPATAFFGGAVADGAGYPILGATCLHQGGFLLAVTRTGTPYCTAAGGSGTLTDSGQTLGTATAGGYGVALGDLDGDGDLDALVANKTEAGLVWLNNGSGVFTDSGQSLSMSKARAVALGDVDGDGDLDAIVARYEAGNIVFTNDGHGTMTNAQSLGGASSSGVALGDLDGDGDLDAFFANYHQGNQVWFNNGSGTFSKSSESLGSSYGLAVALGDFDGDGDLDAFVGNDGAQADEVYLNDGDGTFTAGSSVGSGWTPDVAVGDIDGDGDLDVFAANRAATSAQVWVNDGSGTFSSGGTPATTGATSWSVILGDVDGDGDLDAFVGTSSGMKLYANNGSGGFSTSGSPGGGGSVYRVAVGDLDGDGAIDAFGAKVDAIDMVWLNG